MKVYLAIESSDEWEDYCEITLGVFLRKEKAEEIIAKCKEYNNKELSQYLKCRNCPAYWFNNTSLSDYCEHVADCHMEIDEDGEEQIECSNFIPYYVSKTYSIKELEVIE